MKVESGSAVIQCERTGDDIGIHAFVSQVLSGYGASILINYGAAYLCRKEGYGVIVVIIPSERWIDDLKGEGFEIVQKLSVPTPSGESHE